MSPADALRPLRQLQALPGAYRLCLLMVLAVCAVYADTLSTMVSIWSNSGTFTHGFAVPLVCAWLIYQKKHRLIDLPTAPAHWPLIALLLCGVAWLLGVVGEADSVSQFACVGMMILMVPALLGGPVARELAFPLGFLFVFAVPAGEFLIPWLMETTANFAVLGLNLSGVPVFREGQLLIIPSGHWSVVEACSGIRYLIASLMVGTLYAYLNYYSLRRRLYFVLFAAVTPIVANWIRAYLVILIGHLSSNRLATGVDHLIYGWIFFGLVMLFMFWAGSFWYDAPIPESTPAQGHLPAATARQRWLAVLACGLLILAPKLVQLGLGAQSIALSHPPLAPPTQLAGWEDHDRALTDWKPDFSGYTFDYHHTFVQASGPVGLYLAEYLRQNAQAKLIATTNILAPVDSKGWTKIQESDMEVDVQGRRLQIRSTTLRFGNTDSRLLVWHWYWIGGRVTHNNYWGKAYTALARLSGRGDAAALIAVYTPILDKDQPQERLRALLAQLPADYLGIGAPPPKAAP